MSCSLCKASFLASTEVLRNQDLCPACRKKEGVRLAEGDRIEESDPVMRKRSNFGLALDQSLRSRGWNKLRLAAEIGSSPAYVSSISTGTKNVSASKVDEIAAKIGLNETETVKMHRAAALDQGFRLDLPDDF